ncbi:uncharacterized protein EV422DRAFT_513071 [Fimicolochytrium jonesii]|uniref:uncharacterized protein n=1 Tax=Fimicolochytrium jonesii TaxID=1396493 RepID=UPI0022FDD0BA|nr:uncharacterized protein EV422DRAFT_513071 [Fimicolochytrium jonesii]KAI8827218.1 hypothetical protein EV422DRAFT_513071 [Fimicolochytrium jonesii]
MSSRRSTRKRKSYTSAPAAADISSAWYVGYAEDGESVEAIMQKFQELERMQMELSAQGSSSTVSTTTPQVPSSSSSTPLTTTTPDAAPTPMDTDPTTSTSSPVLTTDDIHQMQLHATNTDSTSTSFTQEQLEELFKRTSGFTVRQAAMNVDVEELDDMELWRMEIEGGEDEEWGGEIDEEHIASEDEFWDDEEFGAPARRAVRRVAGAGGGGGGSRSRAVDRESLIARYKVMQVQMQDRHGNFFVMKKRVCTVDPTLPTYVRIPPAPIPRSWVKLIAPYVPPVVDVPGSRYFEHPDILGFDYKQLGNRFQVIHMDPPFLLPGEEPTPGKISVEEFSTLPIPALLPTGFLFIWAEKELTPHIITTATRKWGFRYVENFAWIKRERNNEIARGPGRYFRRSKVTCLILRREEKPGDVELRHQRSPDCEFDFIKPCITTQLTEQKPEFIYKVIETLLPQAVYGAVDKDGSGEGKRRNLEGERMLSLWDVKGHRRKGWTTVVQAPVGIDLEGDAGPVGK